MILALKNGVPYSSLNTPFSAFGFTLESLGSEKMVKMIGV
jgi:hypothetical protein